MHTLLMSLFISVFFFGGYMIQYGLYNYLKLIEIECKLQIE